MNRISDENFCDQAAIEKVKRRLISASSGRVEKLAFLILSGSFNPIHTQHVRALEATRKHLENVGWTIVAGFLAPSSDAYVKEKLRANALPIGQRIELCKLAVEGSDWISVCSKGELSSNWACRSVRSELEHRCRDALKGNQLTGFEIMGSDAAVRLFEKIVAQRRSGATVSSQRGRRICCFFRPGWQIKKRKDTQTFLVSVASRQGIDLTLLDPASSRPALKPVSSKVILDFIKHQDWAALRSKKWLHPNVLKAFQTTPPYLKA